jgi:hypothetical protein
LLSLPAGTEMFHFPALPPAALCIQAEATAHDGRQVSPFGHPRITAWLPTPRGLSQAPTSFIGSWYQGIHRVPLKTWHNKITHLLLHTSQKQEMLASTVQFSRNGQTPGPDPHQETRAPARKKTQPCGCSLRTQQRAHPARTPGNVKARPETGE